MDEGGGFYYDDYCSTTCFYSVTLPVASVFLAASDLRETSVSEAGSFGMIVAGLVVSGFFAVSFEGFNAILACFFSTSLKGADFVVADLVVADEVVGDEEEVSYCFGATLDVVPGAGAVDGFGGCLFAMAAA